MYSLNVPVPAAVSRRASDLASAVPRARSRRRDEHTLVAKRLGTGDRTTYQHLAARAREVLDGMPAFEARVDSVGYFDRPASGEGPVVYLAVDSPGLEQLHQRLCETFDPVSGIEGDDYVPHITIARGGTQQAARRLADRSIEPVEWTVSEVTFWDADHHQPAGTVPLPA